MSTRRLAVAHFLILFVIAGSLYDIGTRQEHWPFSNYPMFSAVHRQPTLTWLRVFGVTDENREVPLLSYNQLWPLDQSRLPLGLRRIADSPDGKARIQGALTDVMVRYNARQEKGEIKGPPLRAIRLYKMGWNLEPFAANLDHPSSRELVAESAPTAQAR
ncbi:MAG: hypothetical protein V7647_3326 [Acidobacteriota bacterium]|jgi:hypothetical protein